MSTLEYLDEDGTVNFALVPWNVLNEWLSELNGNPHVQFSKKEGVNRGKVLEELDYRRKTTSGFGSLALRAVGRDPGYGRDWREYENEQGFTHLEELLIYQPKDWRKQAREYMYRFKCDLNRQSESDEKRRVVIQLQVDDCFKDVPLVMNSPVLVVLLHPEINRADRYEPLNFLLAYGVKDPIPGLNLEPRIYASFLEELSPLDYFFEFQQHIQGYRTDFLREVGRTSKCPRLCLIKELDFCDIIGQRLAKHMIRQEVVRHIWNRSQKEHICHKRQPLSMIFAGPSGSGKTELAIWLNRLMNKPGDESYIKIDCGKMTDSHELFGMSGAYQGAREGSALNNFVLRMSLQPDSFGVVLLDEIEKAGRDVIHGLYQVIDKGEWTNKRLDEAAAAQTVTIPCHNLIFVLTTNAADEIITGFDDARHVSTVQRDALNEVASEIEHITRLALQHKWPFTEAFMGRVGRVVPFFHLADGDLKDDILRGEMMTVAKLLIEREQEKLDTGGQFGVTQRVTAATKHRMASIIVSGAIREAGVRSIQARVETEMGNRMMHNLLLEKGGIKSGAEVNYSARKEDRKIDYRVETSGKHQSDGMDWDDDDGDLLS